MPYTRSKLPQNVVSIIEEENWSSEQIDVFISVANAMINENPDEEGKAIASGISRARQMKKIDKSEFEILNKKTEKNFIKATVYESNLYVCKSTGLYFTVCLDCNAPQYITESSDGYCKNCNSKLGDAHGDLVMAEDIEEMQSLYMKNINDKILSLNNIIKSLLSGEEFDLMEYIKSARHHVGLNHTNFSDGNGYLIESHCVFDKFTAFGDEYEKCVWKVAFIVSNEIFEKVKDGDILGYSFGGKGFRQPINKQTSKFKETKTDE